MKIKNLKINSNLNGVSGSKNKAVLKAAIERMEIVLLSDYFLQALYDVIEDSNGLEGELSTWKNATVQEIYENLFELILGQNEINLTLHTYYSPKAVIGYGYAGTTDIYLNTKYLGAYTADDIEDLKNVGSNLLHEHGHDCGYSHDFKRTRRRKNSICYLLNEAYEIAFDQIFGHTETAPPVSYYVPWYKRIFSWLR